MLVFFMKNGMHKMLVFFRKNGMHEMLVGTALVRAGVTGSRKEVAL
jgi:hypothetical protein